MEFRRRLVLGLALSVASTIVLVRALAARDDLNTSNGHIALGWLIVEDMFSVLVLVLLPILAVSLGGRTADTDASDDTLFGSLMHEGDSVLGYGLRSLRFGGSAPEVVVVAFVNVGLLAACVFFVAKPLVRLALDRVEQISEEMFTLAVVVIALLVAVAAKAVFGLSDALGAFLAGVMVGDHRLSHRVADEIRPLRDIFGIVFFAAVGMLLEPATVVRAP